MLVRRSIHILFLMSTMLIAAGCQTTSLNIDDNDRFTPAGRISYEIFPGNDQRRSGALLDLVSKSPKVVDGKRVTMRSAGVRATLFVDAEVAGIRGSDHQNIGAGDQVDLGLVIPGPARIKVSAKNIRTNIAARGGVRFFDVFSLEAILGLGLNSTEVRIQSGGIDSQEEDLHVGFLFGVRSTVRPIPLFDLYAEYLVTLASMDTTILDRQIGIDLNVTRNVALFVGYRWWDYRKNQFDNSSDVDIEFRGPTAGLNLKF